MINYIATAVLVFCFACWPTTTCADSTNKEETSLLADWQSNLRWTVDVASRGVFNDDDSFSQHALGLDLHKVFSTRNGDIGTLVFQPYIVNLSGTDNEPAFFDGRDTELTWRIANFNYMAAPTGAFNIRLGHFEIPFGLEQNIGTNGTLRQFSYAERGIKADWGVSANGVLSKLDYEVSLTRGSGNDISDRDNPYVFAGRIGSPSHKNLVSGISFFNGRVQTPAGAVKRHRLGVDLAYYYMRWELLAELSAGEDDDAETSHALLEASWRNREEYLHLYTQFRQQRMELLTGHENRSSITLGVELTILRALSISGQWSKPLEQFDEESQSSEFAVQLRVRL